MAPACCSLTWRELALGAFALIAGAIVVAVVDRGVLGAWPSQLSVAAAPRIPLVEYAPLPPAAGAATVALPAAAGAAAAASDFAVPSAFAHLFAATEIPPPVPVPAADPSLDLSNTAWVSMASADESARLALVLFQTLRDAGTRVPHLVLILMRGGFGSRHCGDAEWMRAHGRAGIGCGALDAGAAEIISEDLLARFAVLGVETPVLDPIERTPWTEGIAGGSTWFWGLALSKLLVFRMTQYRKIVWLDSDDYFLRNPDALFGMPPLTGSVVTACCNFNGPAYAGGGIWVLEPSDALFAKLMAVMSAPRPGTNEGWLIGDMQVIRYVFGIPPPEGAPEPLYPAVNDGRHGYVSGLRYFSVHRGKSDAEFAAWIDGVLDRGKPRIEGYDESLAVPGEIHWRALDMRYDQCVGSFMCSPERDEPDVAISVHFSCLQTALKPPGYATERELMHALYEYADGATRYWFLRWYATYIRAMGGVGLPAPAWDGPPVPGHNGSHSLRNEMNRLARPQL